MGDERDPVLQPDSSRASGENLVEPAADERPAEMER